MTGEEGLKIKQLTSFLNIAEAPSQMPLNNGPGVDHQEPWDHPAIALGGNDASRDIFFHHDAHQLWSY